MRYACHTVAPTLLYGIALLALIAALPTPAVAACTPVTPVPCPNCFAVFVMPDTQSYTVATFQPKGGNHLDLVTRYICANRTGWTEPSTGKQMPILMTIHLGDIVQSNEVVEAEWQLADAAFDNLDACTPAVPYVVTIGNHDIQGKTYQRATSLYETYFGVDRWTSQGYGCTGLGDCDWNAGQWFLGGGDPIAVNSRNNVGGGTVGPTTLQAGRHRAARIEAPNGQPFVFVGLELAFDFPPAAPGFEGVEGDDSAWPIQVLSAYPDAPTIVFHHSMLWAFSPPDTRLRWGPETFLSDSIPEPPGPVEDPDFGTTGGMEAVYQQLIEPFPQAVFLFTGHVLTPTTQADYTIPRGGGLPVWAFLRNYQNRALIADNAFWYGVGWNVIAVFDPDAQEIRVRSYRIDDVEAYAEPPVNFDHTGQPAATECFDTDESGIGERVISWDFQVSTSAPAVSSIALGTLAALVLAAAFRLTGGRR
jgi:hypothetical protein